MIELSDTQLARLADLVAVRLAELVRVELAGAAERDPPAAELLSAAQLAERFGLSRRWVYDHAQELGALPIGDGTRPRLRFDVQRVTAALGACSADKGSVAPDPPQRRRSRRRPGLVDGSELPLLPIRGGGAL